MKGILTFYLNFPDFKQDIPTVIEIFRQCNKELFAEIESEIGYKICVVPASQESCRIEKIDFDKPYPRFVSKMHIDLAELERRREQRAAERRARDQQKED